MSGLITRMILLASEDTALRAIFGSPFSEFRWFDRQLMPERLDDGTVARLTQISTITLQSKNAGSLMNFFETRVQIDVMDKDQVHSEIGANAIIEWLRHQDFVSNAALGSPVLPAKYPGGNFLLNQRGGSYPGTEPPIPVETLDYRIQNAN